MSNCEQCPCKAESFKPFVQDVNGVPYLVYPDNVNTDCLERHMIAPVRMKIDENLVNFPSYIDTLIDRINPDYGTVYVRQGKYGNGKFREFKFVGIAHDGREDQEWREDIKFNCSPDYTVRASDWIFNDERGMSQEAFALFLDKHMGDIVIPDTHRFDVPSQMELYNFVTTLEDSKNERFARKVNVQNGDVCVSLEKQSDDGTVQRLKMFDRFAIQLQFFEGFPVLELYVKLRFRINDGSVTFYYDIEGLEEAFIYMRDWAIAQIKEKTHIRVYL